MKPPSPKPHRAAAAMKRPHPRSHRAADMKRPSPTSPRSAARPSLALRGLRLPQIRAGGMPTWLPSVLGGIRLRHGRGRDRGAGVLPIEPRRRRGGRERGDRGRNPGGRGGDPPGHGGGGPRDNDPPARGGRGGGGPGANDPPARGGRDPPARGGQGDHAPPAGGGHGGDDDQQEKDAAGGYRESENNSIILFDVGRWIGEMDKDDLPEEDNALLYQPFLPLADGGEEEDKVSTLNIELAVTYSAMLDNYVEISKCVAQKWKVKLNVEKLPWKVVQEVVKTLDGELKDLLSIYKEMEKEAEVIVDRILSLSGEPLVPPPLLVRRSPSQLDAKKERRISLKDQRKQQKKREKKKLRDQAKSKSKSTKENRAKLQGEKEVEAGKEGESSQKRLKGKSKKK
ncbi:hypothetical protein ACP70R_042887 [Stipagrostis hirtigluma subsp. patula]